MGVFDWFKPSEPDKTIFEVGNDAGDHIVFTVPTKGSNTIRQALRDAGAVHDNDENNYASATVRDQASGRDSIAYRFRGQRVVDTKEDLEDNGDFEDNGDLEDDRTRDWDYEPTTAYDESKVPRKFRWW